MRCFSMALVLWLAGSPMALASDAEITRLRQENTELRAEVETLRARIAELETEQYEQEASSVSVSREEGRMVVHGRWTPLNVIHGLRRGQQWRVAAWQGKGLAASPTVTWILRSVMSGGIYRGVKAMHLDVDGKLLKLTVTAYDSKIRATGGRRRGRRDDETVKGAMRYEDLRAVATSSQATGRLGTTRFQIIDEQRIILRTLVKAIERGPGGDGTQAEQE